MMAKKAQKSASSGSKKVAKKAPKKSAPPPRVHALKQDQFAKLSWDAKSRGYVGDLINFDEASQLASSQHKPVVVPIRNDPNHVILYLWDVSKNRYDLGETVSIDDPRLPGNKGRASFRNQSRLFGY